MSRSWRWALAAVLAAAYLAGVHMLPQSFVSAEAALRIDAPFVYRLLIPFALGQVLPPDVLDALWLRGLVATLATFAVLSWMPLFTDRILSPGTVAASHVQWACVAVLAAHYVLPHRFHFYYIYDLPAIAMYLALFLLLTSGVAGKWWWAVLAVAVFSLNRETVGIAVIHAGVLLWLRSEPAQGARWALLARVALLIGVVVLVRVALVRCLQAPHGQVAEYMDGDQLRVLANLVRITTQVQHTVTLLYFGCGALFWLPAGWSLLPQALKALAVSSLLPLAPLLVVGNPTELRIFNEFVPLLSLGLGVVVVGLHSRRSQRGSTGKR